MRPRLMQPVSGRLAVLAVGLALLCVPVLAESKGYLDAALGRLAAPAVAAAFRPDPERRDSTAPGEAATPPQGEGAAPGEATPAPPPGTAAPGQATSAPPAEATPAPPPGTAAPGEATPAPPGEAAAAPSGEATPAPPSDATPVPPPAEPGGAPAAAAEAGGRTAVPAPTGGPQAALSAGAAGPIAVFATRFGETRPPSAAHLAAAIAAVLADPVESGRLGLKPAASEAVARVYADRGFAPIWTGEQGLRLGAAALVEAFLRAGDDGLEPDEYLPRLVAGRGSAAAADLAKAELELSAALVRYAIDLKVGRLAPTRTDSRGTVLRKDVDAGAVLAGAAGAADLGAYLRALAPQNSLYAGMRRSLAEYRRAAARGGWPQPAAERLEPGSEGEPVARLRAILRATGDLISFGTGPNGAPFDEALATAVRSFQVRHGLTPDGVVGTETREAMAVGVEERLRQILLNMERVRWLPDDLGDPHIMVNLAGFTLSYVEGGADAMTMRAIVGKPARSSPEFSGVITYLEVNPSWSVPRIIAVEDLLPKIRKDPRFLANNGFSLRTADGGSVDAQNVNWTGIRPASFPYALRQKPGPSNALGRVKFMFPNSFDVYLHDTPARGLFSQPVRAYSSGCIRLEKPVELAAKLLETNGNWSDERLRGAIARGETRSVILSRPVPVHLTYLTSWRDPDGTVQFREDIYGRDRDTDAALIARGSQLLAAGGPSAIALP